MPIVVEKQGQGPAVVLLHGWGMNRQVWKPLAARLSQLYTVYMVDLPGHGEAEYQPGDWEIPVLIDQLVEAVPEPAVWVGWSLGGLVAQQLAVLLQENVKRLALVASSPKIVADSQWEYGMPADDYQRFCEAFLSNPDATRKRFIGLCTLGEENASETRKQLNEMLGKNINKPALKEALDRLLDSDVTDQVDWIRAPTLYILGEYDQVVPSDVMLPLMSIFPLAQSEVISGAAHVPMLSHTESLFLTLHRFISEPIH